MNQTNFVSVLISAIEVELHRQLARLNEPFTLPLHEMLAYHMGWENENTSPDSQGKRIRPLLLLLTCASCKANWESALPAAAAVELVHNFSLVHDDIQDNSIIRRGRDAVWVKWGIPQGINAGDALFVLSNQALLDLSPRHTSDKVLRASKILHDTCLDLTRGQYQDISFEERSNVSIDDYLQMINGKTAALLATCCELGSLLSDVDDSTQIAYREFGHYLGLAFQVKDDFLGIWGETAIRGKSAVSDLVSGKKTLPILHGLVQGGPFAKRWESGPIQLEEVAWLSKQLILEGARSYTLETIDQMTSLALESLQRAGPAGIAGEALSSLSNILLTRNA
jgi:geranylgeranyl diphosphate synthase, type I